MRQVIRIFLFFLLCFHSVPAWEIIFSTIGYPQVTATDPPVGANNVSRTTGKYIWFSQPMDGTTLTPENLFLADLKTMTPLYPNRIRYYPGVKKAGLFDFPTLSANGEYAIVITKGVKDTHGQHLDPEMPSYCPGSAFGDVWMYEFYTGAGVEVISTSIGGVEGSGTGGQEMVPLDAVIVIKFNRNIDPTTITLENIKMRKQETGEIVPITLSYETSTQRLEITPTSPLTRATTYIISLVNLKDNSGNVIP